MKLIDEFKASQDYIDICYMIDHVKNLSVRVSVLEELGYQIGVDVIRHDLGEKHISIGKQREIRMQVTPKFSTVNLARCVIIRKNNFYHGKE